ncbi:hypothetical protein [Hyphomicrobium sp.]|uniref:LEM-3-like GIY-YIG domain-containing protein n=1 Tax=Hyphomicrobium sp. TaxID=82 RepID=UPI0025B9AE61|nr:hypothetical protein [Hyphomicrobium sp.]MCC7253835.1 hypothetical protein [Hyphomicrobium sp.]
MREHYVYALYDIAGVAFYIGAGKGERMLSHVRKARSFARQYPASSKYAFIVDCIDRGFAPEGLKIADGLSRSEAMSLERDLISLIGRRDLETGPLLNSCEGGHGIKNFSPETRALIAERTRAAMADPALRQRLSAKAKERMAQPERRQALSENVRAISSDPDYRARLSRSQQARWIDPARREEARIKTMSLPQRARGKDGRFTSEVEAPT